MWISDVDFPTELVEAARAGRLVIFVGAGASVDPPANLPDFKDLVRKVGVRAGTPPTGADLERMDKFLGTLADRGIDVHGLVAKAIDPDDSRPNRLHRAIIELARAHPPIRIVTTNYDRHLTIAASDAGVEFDVFRGPALPVGDDFEGLVYLHGSLDQEPRRLIVTDIDFGHAYIREAWAARFLDRMFAASAVLFIGYSHGDLVMQYLARSLGPGRARFVLTHREDLPEWKSYGLTPVVYPAPHGSHVALSEALERWAELATLGRTGHRRLIADIVSTGPPLVPGEDEDDHVRIQPERVLTPEESSYLEESLSDPERVRYFVEKARGRYWLSWVARQPAFRRLFAGAEPIDEAAVAVTGAITNWIADNYAMVESESSAALRVMLERQWSLRTLATVTHRLFAQDGAVAMWQTPWLLLSLQQNGPGGSDFLDMLLSRDAWRDRPDLALLLFAHRTRPVLVAGIDWGDPTIPPGFDLDLVGAEHWLTVAWVKVFKPMLDSRLHAILTLVSEQLRTAHRMLRSIRSDGRADLISSGRSAIEPHEQDDIRHAIDFLIDAARDCLEKLLVDDPAAAVAQLERWSKAEEPLFRRLAVHGWRLRGDRDADEKLRWIGQQDLLYDVDTKHEVYLLLQEAISTASDEAVADLLENAMAGPPPIDGEEASPYRRYNLLAWMYKVAPSVESIVQAFTQLQEPHPEYAPREHPDLDMVMTGGEVEDAEPFAADDLHAKIEQSAETALAAIRAFRSVDEFTLTGPTWRGALRSVQGCVAQHPTDGLAIASHLNAQDHDLRRALIDGWAAAQLSPQQVTEVLAMIDTWEVSEVAGPIAQMLASLGRDSRPTAWHQYPAARALAAKLWPSQELTGNIGASDDRVMEAINHPAGHLAEFWTKVTQIEWRQHEEAWAGLTTDLTGALDVMAQAEGRNGLMARTILSSHLRFYFAADPEWTRTHLLPLFDWDDRPADASAAWQGFLWRGRPDDGLLEAGLMDLYLQCCEHADELGRDRAALQLADHLAIVAMSASRAPETWLPRFVTTAPEKLREAWAGRVASRTAELAADESSYQWDRWISGYWTGRVDSVPLPLTVAEASEMAQWVLWLPRQRQSAVALVRRSRAGLTRQGSLLASLADMDLTTDAPNWAEFLTSLLRGTRKPPWDMDYYLPTIVKKLRRAAPLLNLAALIDEAMRLGCTNASEW